MASVNTEIESMLKDWNDEGLLSDIECRMFSEITTVEEAKTKVSDILESRNKEHAALTSFLSTLEDFHSPESSINFVNGGDRRENDSIATHVSQTNPFLNDMVLKCLFGYLPLDDIKSSRLVCSQWNATAEIFLRKRSAIHFKPFVLPPKAFIHYSKFSLPKLPFSAFKFTSFCDPRQLEDFFHQYGPHIKELKLINIHLAIPGKPLSRKLNYDITPWFTTTSSLTTLKIEDINGMNSKPQLKVSLNNFTTLTSLFLKFCGILKPRKNENSLCAPLEISLNNIHCSVGDENPAEFSFNTLVDFSKAKKIFLNSKTILNQQDFCDRFYRVPRTRRNPVFDMTKQVFKAEQLRLSFVNATHWAKAKGDVHCLILESCPFEEQTPLNIEILICINSKINLSVVPQTVKVLKAGDGSKIVYGEDINLPNLQFLSFNRGFVDISLLTLFANCIDLVELELGGIHRNGMRTFHLRFVPQSVKRLTLNFLKFAFANDVDFLNLDTLILKNELEPIRLEDCQRIIQKIRSQVLVINCWDAEYSAEIITLFQTNKHITNIIICLDQRFGTEFVFEGCALSHHVDKKSNYYQFENTIGKAITREQFYQMEDTHVVLNSGLNWFEF